MINASNYTPAEIDAALRLYNGTRRVSFRYDLLNRHDIKIGELDGITRGAVGYGEFRPIKRSAVFRLNAYMQREINFLADRIQPWFVLHMPQGGTLEYPLGIYLLESPSQISRGVRREHDIGAYDKTIIVKQDKFERRFFVEAGANYVAAVIRILNMAGITHIEIEPTQHQLPSAREYPIGKTLLVTINELLREINYETLWFDDYGVARSGRYIPPAQRDVTRTYSTIKDSIVHPKIEVSQDIASRPNVFVRMAINAGDDRELISTRENNDIASPISTANRGRRIVNYEVVNDIGSQEMLDDFVERIMQESTTAFQHITFSTPLMPHGMREVLFCDFPEIFESARKLYEVGWNMPLVYNGEMSHATRMVVRV